MTLIQAFTKEQAAALAHVSEFRVAYWAHEGILEPSILFDTSRRPTRYLYSFKDVVGLRAIGMLREEHGLSLQMLRKAGAYLRQRYSDPWSELSFWVRGKQPFFYDPESDNIVTTDGRAQATARIELDKVASQVERDAQVFAQRKPEDIGKTEQHRNVQRNQLLVKGTRVPVSSILSLAEDGYSVNDIVAAYPSLTVEDVQAILRTSKSPSAA